MAGIARCGHLPFSFLVKGTMEMKCNRYMQVTMRDARLNETCPLLSERLNNLTVLSCRSRQEVRYWHARPIGTQVAT